MVIENNSLANVKQDKPKKDNLVLSWFTQLLFVLIFFALVYWGIGLPHYDKNDDVLMSMVSAGVGLVDSPNDHLIYTHFLIGRILNFCYTMMPSIPWYGLYLVAFQAFSLATIASVIERKYSSDVDIIATSALLLVAISPIQNLQFTSVAVMVALAGAVLFLHGAEHQKLVVNRNFYWLASIIFFSIASMIRNQSALLVLGLTGLVLLIKYFRHHKFKRLLIESSVIAITLVSIVSLQAINWFYYNQGNWKNVYPYINAHWSLINTNRINNSRKNTILALKTVGWSPIDRDIFLSWYSLGKNFSVEKLNELSSQIPAVNQDIDPDLVREKFKEILSNENMSLMFYLIGFTLLFICSARFTPPMMIGFISVVILAMVGLVFIKLPYRLYSPLFFVTSTILLYYWSPASLKLWLTKNRTRKTLFCLISAFLVFPSIAFYRLQASQNLERQKTLNSFVNQLNQIADSSKNPPLIIAWGDSFPFQDISPFCDLQKQFSNLKILGFNSMARSPIVRQRCIEYGINDLLQEIDNRNIILIAKDIVRNRIFAYCLEEHNKYIEFKKLASSRTGKSGSATAYKIASLSNPNNQEIHNNGNFLGFSKADFVIDPTNDSVVIPSGLKQVTESKNRLVLKLKNNIPSIFYSLSKALKAMEYSQFIIEMQAPSSLSSNLDMHVTLNLDSENSQRDFYLRLVPDGKMHSYSYDLAEFQFEDDDKILGVNIVPFEGMTSSFKDTLTLGRLGLIRKKFNTTKSKNGNAINLDAQSEKPLVPRSKQFTKQKP